MKTIPEQLNFDMPAGQIWDLICGYTDAFPINPEWVRSISAAVGSRLRERPCRILDLGGGTGGAAIGLAALGHQALVVDIDPWMVSRCRSRLQQKMLPGTVLQTDWRTLVAADLAEQMQGNSFDVILCLGNALGYQDSWPSNRPSHSLTISRLAETFAKWSGLLAPDGVILLETAIEKVSHAPCRYTVGPLDIVQRASEKVMKALWEVEVRPDGLRTADTSLFDCGKDGSREQLLGRCIYRGHAISWDLIESAAKMAHLDLELSEPLRRIPLTCCVLRRSIV